jgi:hypothetical protein
MRYYVRHTAVLLVVLSSAAAAGAQSFEAVGTRAAGMGGAFVAVADDATAAYWNPAGFALGNIFSLVVDYGSSESDPAVPAGARKRSGFLFGMGMPALGLSYYQLRSTVLANVTSPANPGAVRVDTLVTHHTGATVLQSIGHHVTVGGTPKFVHGTASSIVSVDGARETLLDRASELGGRQSTKFDADLGVMATGGFFKVGLTIRNLMDNDFETPAGNAIALPRQARMGIAFLISQGWAVDTDFDLTTTHGTLGDERNFAIGTEGRIGRKIMVRGGLRHNMTGPSRTAPAAGGSYRVLGALFVDGQITGGTDRADRGWGISTRFVY